MRVAAAGHDVQRITLRVFVVGILAAVAGATIASLGTTSRVRSAATTFSLAGDFSPTANPNGPWSYGFKPVAGAFTLYDYPFNSSGLDLWGHSVVRSLNAPSIQHNGTGHAIINPPAAPCVTWQPGQITLHPGPDGQQSIARFTVPDTGVFQISATFALADQCSTTTDVHVYVNGASSFDCNVDLSNQSCTYTATESLAAGDTIDFAVGYGSDGNFYFDNTFVDATITEGGTPPAPTPRPATPAPPHPPGVGGTVKLPAAAVAAESGVPGEEPASAASGAALVGAAVGSVVVLAAGGWYARRRRRAR